MLRRKKWMAGCSYASQYAEHWLESRKCSVCCHLSTTSITFHLQSCTNYNSGWRGSMLGKGRGGLHQITVCTAVSSSVTQVTIIFRWVFFFCLFFKIYFWQRWVLVAGLGPSLVAASGGHSPLWCLGFSLRWPLLPQSTASRRAGLSSRGTQALECRLSSFVTWA